MSNASAAPRLYLRGIRTKHTHEREENTIVAVKNVRERAGAFFHRTADATIGCLIKFVLLHEQFRINGLYVTEQLPHLSSSVNICLNIIITHISAFLLSFLKIFKNLFITQFARQNEAGGAEKSASPENVL
jgi:hypothetical protein